MPNENNNKTSITPFAITDFRDIKRCFGIKDKNRSGHIYILGKTGTGKSTLIQNMIASDIRRKQGLALIDPHGDLAEAVLASVPKRRVKDVLFFNPADLDFPIAFNPLEKTGPDKRHLIAAGLISAFKKIWPEFWGPRMEHILRHCILALLEYPESTLLDLPPMLTDKDFRSRVLQKVTNPGVRDFWLLEFEKYSAWFRSEAVSPILNKIGQFLATPLIRNIVGQSRSSFDLRSVMDEGKILIANLAKGKIGENNCSLLGSMLVTKLQLAALSRAEIPEQKRVPFHLFIDEIQSFLRLSFADSLSEARKYGLYLVLSHQYIEQLDEKIRTAIFGNAGTLISIRVGAEDARLLAREFHPTFCERDLVCLPNHHIYLKMMIDGHTSNPFSAVTLPPAKNSVSHQDRIIEALREKYGKPRKEVEREILCGRPEAKPTLQLKKPSLPFFENMTPIKLLPNEKLIYRTNPHILFLLGPLAVLFLLWLFLISLTCPLWRVIGPVSLCFLILSTAVSLSALVFYLDWRFNRFYLTTFRVIKERGIIGKKFTSIWQVKIQDITTRFGFWGRIFGFGDLLIESAGELGQVRLKGLPAPLEIQARIEEQIKAIPSSLV